MSSPDHSSRDHSPEDPANPQNPANTQDSTSPEPSINDAPAKENLPPKAGPDPEQKAGADSEQAAWEGLVAQLKTESPKSFPDFDPLGVQPRLSEPQPRLSDSPDFGPSQGPRDYSPPEDKDLEGEEFIPAEPESLSQVEPIIAISWIAAIAGPLGLLGLALFWREAPQWIAIAFIVLSLAGAGYLVYRLPKSRDIDDDGAQT